MALLETALFAIGVYGMYRLVPKAPHFIPSRGGVPQRDVPLARMAERLQPNGAAVKVGVVGDTGPGEHGTRFVVEGVCPGIALRRADEPRRPAAPDLATGDPAFDGRFAVHGDSALVLAVLDAETRRLLSHSAGTMEPGAAVVERGVLTVAIGLSHRADAKAVLRRGRDAVVLAQRLVQPADVPRRLAENARHDPLPGVRLRAALAMGAQGNDVLVAVAGDGAADDATVAAAIEALGPAAPFGLLTRLLHREALVPAAARALGLMGGPAAETALIAALDSQEPQSRLAVVSVLARMGTAAAVAPLRELERGEHGAVGRAAGAAIAEIQRRLPDEPGAVSLAGTDEGQLSLAPDAAGEVSLAPPPDPSPLRRP